MARYSLSQNLIALTAAMLLGAMPSPARAKEPGFLSRLSAAVGRGVQSFRQQVGGAVNRYRENRQQGRLFREVAGVARQAAAAGDVDGAVGALQALEESGPRKGLGGLVDRVRLGAARNEVGRQFATQSKTLAGQGASANVLGQYSRGLHEIKRQQRTGGLFSRLDARQTDRGLRELEGSLVKAAGGLSREGEHGAALRYLQLAKQTMTREGHKQGLRYRFARRQAEGRVWKELKTLERKSGDLEAMNFTLGALQAYVKDSGKGLSEPQLQRIDKAYTQVLTRSFLDKRRGQLNGKEASRVANRMLREASTDGRLSDFAKERIVQAVQDRTAAGEQIELSTVERAERHHAQPGSSAAARQRMAERGVRKQASWLGLSAGDTNTPRYIRTRELDPEDNMKVLATPTLQRSSAGHPVKLDPKQSYLFAVTKRGELRVAEKAAFKTAAGQEVSEAGHPNLTLGQKARIAGEINFSDGAWVINNDSGRYGFQRNRRPSDLKAARDLLALNGVRVKGQQAPARTIKMAWSAPKPTADGRRQDRLGPELKGEAGIQKLQTWTTQFRAAHGY